MILLAEDKICNCCGKEQKEIPKNARINEDGAFWECSCGSTMFSMNEETKKQLLAFREYKKESA
jgi:hypothetical protein